MVPVPFSRDRKVIQDHLALVPIQLDGRQTAPGAFHAQVPAFIDADRPESVADVSCAGRMPGNLRLGAGRRVAGNRAARSAGNLDERHLRSVVPLGYDDSLAAAQSP